MFDVLHTRYFSRKVKTRFGLSSLLVVHSEIHLAKEKGRTLIIPPLKHSVIFLPNGGVRCSLCGTNLM